jgi:hypothetical protein
MRKFSVDRGTHQTHFEIDRGVIKSHSTQADRNARLDRNNELRKNPGAVRDTSFGRLELDIPVTDFKVLAKFYPGIDNPAHPDHKYQLRKFLKSPAADPYRVTERKRRGGL